MSPEQEANEYKARQLAEDGCEVTPPPLVPDKDPPVRPEPCEPDVEPPDEVFLPPNNPPRIIPEPRLYPAALRISNREKSATCDLSLGLEHYPGTPEVITVKSGVLEDDFFLDTIPEIPVQELYRLRTKIPALQAVIDSPTGGIKFLADARDRGDAGLPALEADFDEEVRKATGVSVPLSEILRANFYEWLDTLDTLAQQGADSDLDCSYPNEELWVVCDPTAALGYKVVRTEPQASEKNEKAEARTHFSRESVADANALAGVEAATGLDCIVGNYEVVVTCDGDNDESIYLADINPPIVWRPPGATKDKLYTKLRALWDDEYETITVPTISQSVAVKLVYEVTIPENTYFASSRDVATEMASAAALQQLNCFFPSQPTEISCANAAGASHFPEVAARLSNLAEAAPPVQLTEYQMLQELMTGDWASAAGGLIADIPTNKGFLTSAAGDRVALDTSIATRVMMPTGSFVGSSQSEANDAARDYQMQFLDCEWKSPAYSCACLDPEEGDPPADFVLYPGDLGNLSVTVDPARSISRTDLQPGNFSDDDFPDPDHPTARYPWETTMASLCQASLYCLFCNTEIAPTCATATLKGAASSEIVYENPADPSTQISPKELWTDAKDEDGEYITPIPLTLTQDQYEDYNISSSITGGVAKGAVCDIVPGQVDAQAEAIAQIPPGIRGTASTKACVFTNETVRVHCNIGAFVLDGSIIPSYLYEPIGDADPLISPKLLNQAALGADYEAVKAQVLAMVLPPYAIVPPPVLPTDPPAHPGIYVEVPAGSYESTISKEVATLQAYAFARAALYCEYGYKGTATEPKVYCGAADLSDELVYPSAGLIEGDYGTGQLASSPGDDVFHDSIGYKHVSGVAGYPDVPVMIGPFSSPVDVDVAARDALTVAITKLNCYFRETSTAKCHDYTDNRATRSDGRKNISWNFYEWGDEINLHPDKILANIDPKGATTGAAGEKSLYVYPGDAAQWQPTPPSSGSPWSPPAPPAKSGIDIPYATAIGESTQQKALAQKQAAASALAMLDCTQANWGRINIKCPTPFGVLLEAGIVQAAEFTSVSTRLADVEAEQAARDRTVCAECAPYRLLVKKYVKANSAIEYKVKLCNGGATFWNLSGGKGAGAKLKECVPDKEGMTLKDEIRYKTCANKLSSEPDQELALQNGVTLYWLKFTCCPKTGDPDKKEPAVILIDEAPAASYNYTKSKVLPGSGKTSTFYPTELADKKNEDPEATYVYVGATVVPGHSGVEGDEDAPFAIVQHTDENVTVQGLGGGGGEPTGSFCTLYNKDGHTYLLGGTITGGNGGAAVVADFKVRDKDNGVGDTYPNKQLYLVCSVEATVVNKIMQPGLLLKSAGLTTEKPTDHVFTVDSKLGDIFREVGRWTTTEFLIAGACGLHLADGCPGSFHIT